MMVNEPLEKNPTWIWILFMVPVLGIVLSCQPVIAMDASPNSDMIIQCDVPGRIIEAGETAEFDLIVTNNGPEIYRKLWFETFDGKRLDWKMRFEDESGEINRLSLKNGGSKNITFIADTSSDTPPGEYTVRLHIGDGWYWLYLTISRSHKGEKGTLELKVVDTDGEKVKGATIDLIPEKISTKAQRLMSAADGSISALVADGTYTLKITKPGYITIEKKEVIIKGGITTNAGTIMLEKTLFAADLVVKSPIITTSVGKKPVYDMVIKNTGKSDDTFRLSTQGTPEGWYIRFREGASDSSDISELFLKSGEDKSLVIEAIPPYGVQTGDYNFTVCAESSETEYSQDLTVKIRGNYDLKVYTEKYRYEVNRGDAVTFPLTVTNGGNAGPLTNVNVDISAPDGWKAEIIPKTVASIPPGEKNVISIKVIPPANIVASEYKISTKVSSDQTEKSDEFHILVKEQSMVAGAGILVLGLVGGGVFYMFRKYKRR
ncbi:MAG: alpha-1,6-galactosidase [Methanomicrobiales archaeon]|nr:alpha-1,6-galactosidase [Methanomicrobiales archaeon]